MISIHFLKGCFMKERVYTPIGVNLRIIESKALAAEIAAELNVPDPIITDTEEKVNENSAEHDAGSSNISNSKGSKASK
jgi:hypothetical protein